MTHSGHRQLKIVAVQLDPCTPFRQSQIPAVISNGVGQGARLTVPPTLLATADEVIE
jgi:hypothetical protein